MRILPNRLLSSSPSPSIGANSRSESPMRPKNDGSGLTGSPASGLALKVVIMRARNLAAKDRSGTSDPYLVVTLGDSRVVTHSVPKTLNPEWNVIEELPISSVQNLVLDVICWDKDRFGKDYLGEFDLALEEIFQNEQPEQEPRWFPLKSKRPGKKTSIVSGEVQLQFTLFDATDPTISPQQLFEKFSTLVGSVPVGSSRNGLKKKRRQNPYAFTNGDSDVVGIIYLEICKITDLPPESNLTRTGFDMDPFVVASLGKKTYRTRRVRHNLNPIFNEKMIFPVQGHEKQYSFAFTVIDHDKYSGNDFIASCNLPIQTLIEKAPQADPETGLYEVRTPEPETPAPVATKSRLQRLGVSRSSSTSSLSKMMRSQGPPPRSVPSNGDGVAPQSSSSSLSPADALNNSVVEASPEMDSEDPDFSEYSIPLKMKNLDKWESKHNPIIYLKAKYVPYPALRQQFWRALLKQYDTDESGLISRIELSTMLDTLGSTLKDSTIDSFFSRFPHKAADNEDSWELTFDEAVLCLEDQLQAKTRSGSKTPTLDVKNLSLSSRSDDSVGQPRSEGSGDSTPQIMVEPPAEATTPNDEGEEGYFDTEDSKEEHVVEIRECPICHQPRLNKRSDGDIITHIATCASQDWRQVNTVLVGGFVTASQAQRKWYSKVITKISYGGYKLGANSANILVQDRLTGQINEEKMSVYVRLGIRLLYKGLKSRDMENKRIRRMLKNLSIKQGKKFDDPASRDEIEKFIEFHRLDMSEVLLPIEEFKNFNEFFYRALKPGARPCSAPDNPHIIVSPADCRSVVFNQLTQATKIWVKGREFNMKRLLGDAYPDDVSRFENGALGIFRLAPQDYHRFHIPVDGVMGKPKTIAGEYYTVNPMAIRSALDVYGENVRVLVPIDSEVHGRVMVICVGAMMVGSTVITRNEGERVRRAEELGYFAFGGSTLLVLFEPGKMRFDDDLVDNSNGALETLIRVGMSVGHSPNQVQWAPDMRKNEKDITEADKQDAKRRIQGSAAMEEESPGDSGDDGRAKKRMSMPPTVNTMAASAL
ncbi:hypothetical protein TRIATDRAFT_151310 [Trichoderma atroviride IMI 206040]|uniref:Phosphatidylserine decarboxylase proenzyme 2 n=1 Tax=Hypocrea atroviridis (strain ATCC 20476 / IMI 206040) TaxID=452589 RepID=G9NWN1_HYPAI|nr:uncharacterized protein TRIATDRAFT_151310 [Trichoderma atroviride IMI 206040]EHK45540.1 hypothetical protein TRIATDRAFT_151310 [Trichoderma atroviride IMI 206040]